MAWGNSGLYLINWIHTLSSTFTTRYAIDLLTAGNKVALYNNSVTPDFDATAANSAYNVGTWGTANEQYQAGQWAQGGVVVATNDITTVAGGIVMLDADDTASGTAFTASTICHVTTTPSGKKR